MDETVDIDQTTPVTQEPGMNWRRKMKSETQVSEAGQDYAAAHSLHYETKDLRGALDLYRRIIARYPDTREAGYSRSQIHNILNAVVPTQALFDAQVDLALAHCAQTHPSASNRIQGGLQ